MIDFEDCLVQSVYCQVFVNFLIFFKDYCKEFLLAILIVYF